MADRSYHDTFFQHRGKVADKWAAYLDAYDHLLGAFKSHPVRVLEIGLQNGGSLELLGSFFSNAERIVGCDINERCGLLTFEDTRISVVVGDATDDAVRDEVVAVCPSYDIVIDDGSHTSVDIIRAFVKYFGLIRPGGIFLAEDLHCSYWQEFGGGLFHPHSAIAFFKRLVDIVNHEHWGVARSPASILAEFEAQFGLSISEDDLRAVDSVEFTNSICAVRKKPIERRGLGPRVRAGSEALVVAEVFELEGESCLPPCQDTNPTAISESSPELQACKAQATGLSVELKRSEAQLAGLSLELKRSEAQRAAKDNEIAAVIAELTSSTSWRVTAPLRLVSRLGRRARNAGKRSREFISTQGLRRRGLRLMELLSREGPVRLLRRAATKGIASGEGPGTVPVTYEEWLRSHDPVRVRRQWDSHAPIISIVMPTYNSNTAWLAEAIESVREQTYTRWELCIADDASTGAAVRDVLDRYCALDARIKVAYRSVNGGIAASTRDALDLATGEFVAFLDHDDRLHPDALAALADVIAQDPEVDLLYTDEDKISPEGVRSKPFFKPDWSPHLALSQAYLGHLVCYRATLLTRFRLRDEATGAQDYDLWLRASTAARRVAHIPRILYHWREHAESTSANPSSKPYAHEAGRRAVNDYLRLRYPELGLQAADGDALFTYKVRFELPKDLLISIVIPTRDKVSLLIHCLNSILDKSSWRSFEIIILDNGSKEPETIEYFTALEACGAGIKVVKADVPFNWSRLNNIGASHAAGDVLIFLNNDTAVIAPDWMEQLAGYALLPDVGVVGALLLFEDGAIQHSGVVVGMGGWADHIYRTLQPEHIGNGPFVSPVLTRNVTAVTGACTAIARERFDELGGYDESFIICGSDVELGLRAHKKGYFNVMCAQARLYHLESKTRTPNVPEEDFVQSALKYEPYRTQVRDPFYSPSLALDKTTPELAT